MNTLSLRRLHSRLWTGTICFMFGNVPLQALDITFSELRQAFRIARVIAYSHKRLDNDKYVEYGLGILRASQRYGVDPAVLISIAHQESSFRDSLPEGRAGEIGICQIRKIWLKNPEFLREFGRLQIRDLKNPSMNFLVAAWILRDLKETAPMGALPYWSYYNARKFENRYKYFTLVAKKLARLKKQNYPVESAYLRTRENRLPAFLFVEVSAKSSEMPLSPPSQASFDSSPAPWIVRVSQPKPSEVDFQEGYRAPSVIQSSMMRP